VETTPLKFQAQTLTFYNGKLWTIVNAFGSTLAELDTTTGKATRVVSLPPAKLGNYSSIVAQGGKMFVMRYKNNTTVSVDTFQP
jgi:hypothetical protein